MTRSVAVHQAPSSMLWLASADREPLGEARAFVRPDGRCFVRFRGCAQEAYRPLLAAIDDEVGLDLSTTVEEADERTPALTDCGFAVHRRESVYRIPTDPLVSGLAAAALPASLASVGAADVDEDRLRALDDALRQDVPGTDGWRWRPADFRAETYESDDFDPATYRVAIDRAVDDYVGLVRVWMGRTTPRLGLIAVLPAYRRRGVARALLAEVFAILHARGRAEVSGEVDDANAASTHLVRSLGARRVGGHLELLRPARRPPPRL